MHILIVSHYYPPLNAIASFRPASFARYFVEQGIRVTVLTTHKSEREGGLDLELYTHPLLTIVEVPYRQLKFWSKPQATQKSENKTIVQPQAKASTSNQSLLNTLLVSARKWMVASLGSLVDYQFFWTRAAIRQAEKIHRQESVDVVLSSFGPPAAHKIASAFKAKFPDVKWIADYRDLWSNNHLFQSKGLLHFIEKRMEKNVVGRADYVTSVSQPLVDDLTELFKGKIPAMVIYNGYNGDMKPLKSAQNIRKPIRIVYTGTIYEGRRDPSSLFRALNELAKEGKIFPGDVQVSFYGPNTAVLNGLIAANNASDWVSVNGNISHSESTRMQQEADFVLHLESSAPDARGVLTGKLFEYMISGTPILAIGVDADCASAQVIEQTKTGEVFGTDIVKIKWYIESVLNGTVNKEAVNEEVLKQFSRNKQAERMLSVVKRLLPSKN